MREIRATELPAYTTADVEVLSDGTFFVRVYYGMATGESRGAHTFTEGVARAISEATGKPYDQPTNGAEPGYALSSAAQENLARVAADLGVSAAAVLERLALQVKAEPAGRVRLATPAEQNYLSMTRPDAVASYTEMLPED
ncbi:hypothetical protein ACQEVF_59710 [Nonomuraea polychroma]|uniref:hypothetical protein n=1 Tax=Nonomuraea polychroma TaxID=46176 RepID=UPI003D8EF590